MRFQGDALVLGIKIYVITIILVIAASWTVVIFSF
jgi:hypothetical protein